MKTNIYIQTNINAVNLIFTSDLQYSFKPCKNQFEYLFFYKCMNIINTEYSLFFFLQIPLQ